MFRFSLRRSHYRLIFSPQTTKQWTMLIRSRRPKRNRYVQIGLFFMIYTCYHAYSAAVDKREVSDEPLESPEATTFMSLTTTESAEVNHRSWKSILPDLIFFSYFAGSGSDRSNDDDKSLAWISDTATEKRKLHAACNRTISTAFNECKLANGEDFPAFFSTANFLMKLFTIHSTAELSFIFWWRFSLSSDWR